jgi:hypothetical protein
MFLVFLLFSPKWGEAEQEREQSRKTQDNKPAMLRKNRRLTTNRAEGKHRTSGWFEDLSTAFSAEPKTWQNPIPKILKLRRVLRLDQAEP